MGQCIHMRSTSTSDFPYYFYQTASQGMLSWLVPRGRPQRAVAVPAAVPSVAQRGAAWCLSRRWARTQRPRDRGWSKNGASGKHESMTRHGWSSCWLKGWWFLIPGIPMYLDEKAYHTESAEAGGNINLNYQTTNHWQKTHVHLYIDMMISIQISIDWHFLYNWFQITIIHQQSIISIQSIHLCLHIL